MKIMNCEVFIENLNTLYLTQKQGINTINPHSYVTAKNDELSTKAPKDGDKLIANSSVITIKQGSVIATDSVVTKDVEEYYSYRGSPTKKIKHRFDSKTDLDHIKNYIKKTQCRIKKYLI